METELVCDFCDNPLEENESYARSSDGQLIACADCMGLAEQYTDTSV